MTRANPSLPQRLEEFAQRSRGRDRAGARKYGVCTENLTRYAHLLAQQYHSAGCSWARRILAVAPFQVRFRVWYLADLNAEAEDVCFRVQSGRG